MRIYKQLPCGCFVSEDGGGCLIPCCYPEIEEESEIHKLCMKLYFEDHKTVEEIERIIRRRRDHGLT